MSFLWIVRSQNLVIQFLLQVVVSLFLIYKGKNKISYVSELLIMVCFMLYGNFSFEYDQIVCYFVEYVLMKMLLVGIVWIAKHFSFYVLVCATHEKKRGYKFFIKKKRFLRIQTRIWNKVDYGIRIKKGYPYMVSKKHPETGIYFDKNGFPKFKAIVTIKLKRKLWKKERDVHFYNASRELYAKISKSSRLASKFTKKEIQTFKSGDVPDKYTWHHHQDKGVLQLVERKVHSEVRHRGGFSIWGKRE